MARSRRCYLCARWGISAAGVYSTVSKLRSIAIIHHPSSVVQHTRASAFALHRPLLGRLEERLVLLLGLDESLLESVRVCAKLVSICKLRANTMGHSLSLLAKRMARVWASGSPSLTSAAAFHTQLRSEPTLGDSFMSGTTAPVSTHSRHLYISRQTYRSGWRRP
jgi:hypothetical protein